MERRKRERERGGAGRRKGKKKVGKTNLKKLLSPLKRAGPRDLLQASRILVSTTTFKVLEFICQGEVLQLLSHTEFGNAFLPLLPPLYPPSQQRPPSILLPLFLAPRVIWLPPGCGRARRGRARGRQGFTKFHSKSVYQVCLILRRTSSSRRSSQALC